MKGLTENSVWEGKKQRRIVLHLYLSEMIALVALVALESNFTNWAYTLNVSMAFSNLKISSLLVHTGISSLPSLRK